jgi:hypothetical protein
MPTAWRVLDRIDADRLPVVRAARAAARERAWAAGAGPDPGTELAMDLDSTITIAHSEKENAAATWKKTFGFHPLLCFLDRPEIAGSRRPSRHLVRGDLPELPDLQRRRLRRHQEPRHQGRCDHPAGSRRADPLRRPRRGRTGHQSIIRDPETGGVKVAQVAHVDQESLLVHDAHAPDPSVAFSISRLTDSGYLNQSPIGIFRQVDRPTYDDQARAQINAAAEAAPGDRSERLAGLIGGGDTWTVNDGSVVPWPDGAIS